MPKSAVLSTLDVVEIFEVFTELQYGQWTHVEDCCNNLFHFASFLSSSSVDVNLLPTHTISILHSGQIVENSSALLKK